MASFTLEQSLGTVRWTSRWCYSVPLAALLLPVVLKRELAELAWISMVLFISLTLFVLLNFILLVIDPQF